MHSGYQPGQRHVSAAQAEQSARQHHVPPPPPQISSTPGPQGMQLPPPPPRSMQMSNTPHGMLPPPPGSSYVGWPQQGWNRLSNFPTPPSMVHATYNPNAYQGYYATPAPPVDQPLTSATYIPGGESFGPG
ncbi:mitogen-activated protein kinase kinase kinase, partial [Cryomyces antarcticus]